MIGKLRMARAVADDCGNPDFVIIARTDGLSAVDAPEHEARHRPRRRARPALPRHRASPTCSGASSRPRTAARSRRSRRPGPTALPGGALRVQLVELVQVVQRSRPDHLRRARRARLQVHLHHSRRPARHGTRALAAPRADGRHAGAGLHRAPAPGVGGGRGLPDPRATTSSPASRTTTSSARPTTPRASAGSSSRSSRTRRSCRARGGISRGLTGHRFRSTRFRSTRFCRSTRFRSTRTAPRGHGRTAVRSQRVSCASSSRATASAAASRARFSGALSQPLAPDGCGRGTAIASPSRWRDAHLVGEALDPEHPACRQTSYREHEGWPEQTPLPVEPEAAQLHLGRSGRAVAAAAGASARVAARDRAAVERRVELVLFQLEPAPQCGARPTAPGAALFALDHPGRLPDNQGALPSVSLDDRERGERKPRVGACPAAAIVALQRVEGSVRSPSTHAAPRTRDALVTPPCAFWHDPSHTRAPATDTLIAGGGTGWPPGAAAKDTPRSA